MDFNKLKVFGFPRHVMNYKVYNPLKIRYLKAKRYGYFEAPKNLKNPELTTLVSNYKQRIEYEKHMNPKGYKLTWTSNMPKVAEKIDYVNPKFLLVRSQRDYAENQVKYLVGKNESKFEIKQFFEKLYQMKVNTINTAIIPGQVKRFSQKNAKGGAYYRTRDRKKAVLTLDFPIDEKFRKVKENKQKN